MSQSTFDLQERWLKKEIQKRAAKLVFIQLPEGLKPFGPRLANAIEEVGSLAIVSADPCYGACDLATLPAERLGADLIVHFGHSEQLKQVVVPTLYVEARARSSIKSSVKKAILHLKPWRKIGLVTTVQHVHKLDDAREVLLKAGKTVAVGASQRLKYAGQVIGCDYSNAKAVTNEVEAFLFVGGGKFHAIGVALATTKPTVVADPYEKRAFTIEAEVARVLKKRWANIHEAQHAENFGVLIGLKGGQKRVDQALTLRALVKKAEKKVTLFALTEITSQALMEFPTIDSFINTACPRLSLDDSFRKPLLTPNEALVALGKLRWEELCKKGWFEN